MPPSLRWICSHAALVPGARRALPAWTMSWSDRQTDRRRSAHVSGWPAEAWLTRWGPGSREPLGHRTRPGQDQKPREAVVSAPRQETRVGGNLAGGFTVCTPRHKGEQACGDAPCYIGTPSPTRRARPGNGRPVAEPTARQPRTRCGFQFGDAPALNTSDEQGAAWGGHSGCHGDSGATTQVETRTESFCLQRTGSGNKSLGLDSQTWTEIQVREHCQGPEGSARTGEVPGGSVWMGRP